MTLDELAIKHGTDKSSLEHDYARIYDLILRHKKNHVLKVLEIGVGQGNSLRMWQEYFPHAEIYGLDIISTKLFKEDRITCYQADQSDPESLLKAVQLTGEEFDLIIDDGSHMTNHQDVSFLVLFPYLKSGGLYVIEDKFTSIKDVEGMTIIPKR